MKNTEDVVDIKETTLDAFKTMINYIYTVPEFYLKDITCPKALFDVLNIAERYEIPALVEEITLILRKLPITSENMMFTVTTAKNFAHFEEVSKMLLEKCNYFLTTKLKTSGDVLCWIQDTRINFPGVDKDVLFDMLSATANAKCGNCLEVNIKCRDGEDVTSSDYPKVLRSGLKVAKRANYSGKNSECVFSSCRSSSPLSATNLGT